MNTLLVFTVLFAGACMADVSHIVKQGPVIETLRYEQDASPDGTFNYNVETENGIKTAVEGNSAGEMRGEYHYIDSDGKPVDVTWTAGTQGFVAQGASIPEVPESVLRTLKFNEEHPYEEPVRKP